MTNKTKNSNSFFLRIGVTVLLMFLVAIVHAQDITVKGVVTDQRGEAIIGATVKVKGNTSGAITDINGNYTISCPTNATLEFSYVGNKPQSIATPVRDKKHQKKWQKSWQSQEYFVTL